MPRPTLFSFRGQCREDREPWLRYADNPALSNQLHMNKNTTNTKEKNDVAVANVRKGGMEANIYSTEGKKTGSVTLPESVFAVRWSNELMHQVVTSMQSNARPNVAHVKERGDVRGGGRKPWR